MGGKLPLRLPSQFLLSYIGVVTTEEAAMRPMLVALTLMLATHAAPALAQTGFASCFILFRPSDGKSIAYLTGAFPASKDEPRTSTNILTRL